MNIKTQKIKKRVLKKLKLKADKSAPLDSPDERDQDQEESELDSDEELQLAFARKQLKPGLNVELTAPKNFVNDSDGLKRKLSDFYLNLDWIERMDVTVEKGTTNGDEKAESEADLANDDFKRESSFVEQAKKAAEIGLARLNKLGVPTTRPTDYFAEMVKSDDHMKKVRENLLSKHAEMERREKVKKLRELKKMGKKIQQEAEKKKQEAKKSFNDSVKKFKRGEKDDLNIELENEDDGESKRAKKRKEASDSDKSKDKNQKTAGIKKKGKKAQFKDKKYGFGGRKKRSKYNTKESYSEAFKAEKKPKAGAVGRGGRGKPPKKFTNKNKPKKRF